MMAYLLLKGYMVVGGNGYGGCEQQQAERMHE